MLVTDEYYIRKSGLFLVKFSVKRDRPSNFGLFKNWQKFETINSFKEKINILEKNCFFLWNYFVENKFYEEILNKFYFCLRIDFSW